MMISTSIPPLSSSTVPVAGSTAAQVSTNKASIQGGTNSFANLVQAGMQQTHGLEQNAQTAVMDLLRGGNVQVHDAMIATQQSELAFELALQVRNKAVSAYQQMMQMQF